ncbi:MAG: hypothetical protein NT007_00015 [Candidatus Kapabacteria bacterium]|nr:hypothetical protein [Candidatus Kapabacteria bacterium]
MNFYGYDIKGFDVMDEGCQEMQFWNIDRYMNRLIGNTGISEGSGAEQEAEIF